jgi:hypothetical protein
VRGGGATTIVPNPWPLDLAVADSGLENAIAGGSSFAEADPVMQWDAAQQAYSDFYYFDRDDALWRDLYNHPADSDDVIPPGTGVLVIRSSAGDAHWYMEQSFKVER